MTGPHRDDHEFQFESMPSDGGSGVEEQNNQVEELTAALQQSFPSGTIVSIAFNQSVPELPEPHVNASPDALQPVPPVPEPHVESRPYAWRIVGNRVGLPCPCECEWWSCPGNDDDCVYTKGHEGIHICYGCCETWCISSAGCERWEQAEEDGAEADPDALFGHGQASAQSAQAAAIQLDPLIGRCSHNCSIAHGPGCVSRCGKPSGDHESHICWCCHLVRVGAVHDTSSSASWRFTHVQRKQRDDLVEAWANVKCPECDRLSKSTTGSNSNFLRLKCVACKHLFCKRVVIWPRNNVDAMRHLDGFHRSVIKDGRA